MYFAMDDYVVKQSILGIVHEARVLFLDLALLLLFDACDKLGAFVFELPLDHYGDRLQRSTILLPVLLYAVHCIDECFRLLQDCLLEGAILDELEQTASRLLLPTLRLELVHESAGASDPGSNPPFMVDILEVSDRKHDHLH